MRHPKVVQRLAGLWHRIITPRHLLEMERDFDRLAASLLSPGLRAEATGARGMAVLGPKGMAVATGARGMAVAIGNPSSPNDFVLQGRGVGR